MTGCNADCCFPPGLVETAAIHEVNQVLNQCSGAPFSRNLVIPFQRGWSLNRCRKEQPKLPFLQGKFKDLGPFQFTSSQNNYQKQMWFKEQVNKEPPSPSPQLWLPDEADKDRQVFLHRVHSRFTKLTVIMCRLGRSLR